MLHDAGAFAIAWGLGLWLAVRHRRWWLVAVFALFLAALGVSLLPNQGHLNALLRSEHWLALAAIVAASGRRGPSPPRLASLAPMLLAGQGLGALLLAATIAGKALLEPGARGRGWLVAAMLFLGGASALDDQLLWLWDGIVHTTGLGSDPASLLARALVELTRLVGWGAGLRWGFGGRGYSSAAPDSDPVMAGAGVPASTALSHATSKRLCSAST
jgi:hypothetical protein